MKIQTIASVISISLALGLVGLAQAAEGTDAIRTDGFYGGVSYRDNTPTGFGINFGAGGTALSRTPVGVVDDAATRALLFGGYRWHNDLAVEAAVSSLDQYMLRPLDANAQRGVGLRFGQPSGEAQGRSLNLDVFTSWTIYKSVALYGRLGYVQAEAPQLVGVAPVSVVNARGLRDNMNYGVGMRYDMNSALGLRLEYSRFGRFAGEIGTSIPESDQVTLGVQFKF
jgi:outer membrane protein with beta-barrel domain